MKFCLALLVLFLGNPNLINSKQDCQNPNKCQNLLEIQSIFSELEDLGILEINDTRINTRRNLGEIDKKIQKQASIFNDDQLKNGGFLIYLFGVFYFFCAYTQIYQFIYQPLIEETVFRIDKYEDHFGPIVFCLMTSLPYLFVMFFADLEMNSNFGRALVLGTDGFNIYAIFGLILLKNYTHEGILDSWLYIRDTFYYLIGLCILAVLYILNLPEWYYGFVLIAYYMFFYLISWNQDSLKQLVLKVFGVIEEQNQFNPEEIYIYKKRRNSITDLSENCYINLDDKALKKHLDRSQALTIITFQNDHKKQKIYINFQKMVIQIIHGIQYKNNLQKIRQANMVNNMHPKPKIMKDKKDQNEIEIESYMQRLEKKQLQKEKEQKQTQKFLEKTNLIKSHQDIDHQKLINNKQSQEPQQENEQESNLSQNQISIAYPSNKGIKEKLLYLFLFPIKLIMNFMPINQVDQSNKVLILSIIINLGIITALTYFITSWSHIISYALNIQIEVIAFTLGTLGFSYPFIRYNLLIAQNDSEVDFMQSYLQLGIFKIGICTSLPWIISTIQDGVYFGQNRYSFFFCIIIHAAMVFGIFIMTYLNQFKSGQGSAKFLIALGIMFFVASIVIIEIQL